jgi:hypothetical protein
MALTQIQLPKLPSIGQGLATLGQGLTSAVQQVAAQKEKERLLKQEQQAQQQKLLKDSISTGIDRMEGQLPSQVKNNRQLGVYNQIQSLENKYIQKSIQGNGLTEQDLLEFNRDSEILMRDIVRVNQDVQLYDQGVKALQADRKSANPYFDYDKSMANLNALAQGIRDENNNYLVAKSADPNLYIQNFNEKRLPSQVDTEDFKGKTRQVRRYGLNEQGKQDMFNAMWLDEQFRNGIEDDFRNLTREEQQFIISGFIQDDPTLTDEEKTALRTMGNLDVLNPRQKDDILSFYGFEEYGDQIGAEQILSTKPIKKETPEEPEIEAIDRSGNSWLFGDKPIKINRARISYFDETGVHENKPLNNASITQLVQSKNPFNDDPKVQTFALATVPRSKNANDVIENKVQNAKQAGATDEQLEELRKRLLEDARNGELDGVSGREIGTVWIPYRFVKSELENKYSFKGLGKQTNEVRRRTKDGKVAVFDADTKEFIRWE